MNIKKFHDAMLDEMLRTVLTPSVSRDIVRVSGIRSGYEVSELQERTPSWVMRTEPPKKAKSPSWVIHTAYCMSFTTWGVLLAVIVRVFLA